MQKGTTMTRTRFTLALAALSAAVLGASAHAESSTASDTTRAQVQAELQRARDAGELSYSYEVLGIAQPIKATRTASTQAPAGTPAQEVAKPESAARAQTASAANATTR